MDEDKLTLVARKSHFGLPTSCPSSLPIYIYLKFAKIPFNLDFNLIYPDSDQVPYVEYGPYVAYNNEKSGVIQSLKEDGIADIDSDVCGVPEWISTKAMVNSWLSDALLYEIWLGANGNPAHEIYYSDLPWPIGKFLFFKQVRTVKQLLGITKENADNREEEIYRKAKIAYDALEARLGEQDYLFDNRSTSLDAYLLSHVLIALYALPETSVLRDGLLKHANLVRYAEHLKTECIDSSSTSVPLSQSDPSSSSTKRGPSNRSSKPKPKQKREKTEEEKKFRKRAKYFLLAQVVAVLVFLSVINGSDGTDMELDDDDLNYD
ncbi:transporter [Lithospermum erythrorhizon]|uniref:Transporter n=1 Tax=Lithospermum erythrorhizon TaxID=34254 RepID=A0AAV3QH92_LITER